MERKKHRLPAFALWFSGLMLCVLLASLAMLLTQCAHQHTEAVAPGEPAGCVSPGKTDGRYCMECGEITKAQALIPALGHTRDNWVVEKAPTCTQTGQRRCYCTVCGLLLETAEMETEPHAFGEWDTVEPTCEKAGKRTRVCQDCGDSESEAVMARGHVPGPWVDETPATCQKEGVRRRSCNVCGQLLERRNVAKSDHTYSGYTIRQETHWQVCSVCGHASEARAHSFTDGICTDCGYVYVAISQGLSFTLSADGAGYVLSGLGTCTDSAIMVPDSYQGLPVVEVGDGAFSGSGIGSIVLPTSIRRIGTGAFANCPYLSYIAIPWSVYALGANAFAGCAALGAVSFSVPSGWSADGTPLELGDPAANAELLKQPTSAWFRS